MWLICSKYKLCQVSTINWTNWMSILSSHWHHESMWQVWSCRMWNWPSTIRTMSRYESIWVDMSRVLKLQITEFPSWGRFPARSACLDFWILRGLDFEGPTLSVETCQDPKACFAAAMSSLEVLSTDSSFRMLGLESWWPFCFYYST